MFVVFLWTCNFTENLKHFLFVHVFSFVVAFPPFLLLSGCLVLALWPFEGMCSWKSPLHVTVCAFEAFKSFLFFIIFRLNWLFRTLYEFLHFFAVVFPCKGCFCWGGHVVVVVFLHFLHQFDSFFMFFSFLFLFLLVFLSNLFHSCLFFLSFFIFSQLSFCFFLLASICCSAIALRGLIADVWGDIFNSFSLQVAIASSRH